MSAPTPLLRVFRSRDEARRAYDRLAPWYEHLAGATEGPVRDAAVAWLAARPGERALEIGFGTGTNLVTLARAVGSDGRVTGVDLSAGMRDRAAARLAAAGIAGVELHLGDAAQLPFPDGSFDVAVCCFTLELFDTDEIPRVLGELRRVLRPGGRLAIAAMAAEGGSALARRSYAWAHVWFEAWADCRPIPAAALLTSAGFAVVHAEKRTAWGLPMDVVGAVRT